MGSCLALNIFKGGDMENQDLGKTSTGIQPNVAGLLCYLVGFVTGIVFLAIEKENKFVRFHAMQSLVAFGFLFVLSIVLSFIGGLVCLVMLALWIIMMVKAYQGEQFKLPVAGDIAEKSL